MAENKIHNLDEGVEESFKFELLGHIYKFSHLNTDEIEELQSFEKDDNKGMKKFLYKFITPVGKGSPSFQETTKKMITPHWKKFMVMVKTEFGG